MATKPTFNTLGMKVNKDTEIVKFNDKEIKVIQYLPISDKIDLIQTALQKAEENGVYNDMLLEVYFNVNIIYLYTDILFTEKQKEDELAIYDAFQSSGLLNEILAAMDEKEYNSLVSFLAAMKQDNLTYGNSAAAVIRQIVQDLPKNAEAAANFVDGFDETKYSQVFNLAQATGYKNGAKSSTE